MKIAIFSDIHGNMIALDAVLTDIEREAVTQMICLGDVAVSGPQPHEVTKRLRALECPVVMGNTDEWLLDPQLEDTDDERMRRIFDIDAWCFEQLTSEDITFVNSFQTTIEQPLSNDEKLLCFHGSPKSNTQVINASTPDNILKTELTGFEASIMAGGHTHTPMLRRYKDALVINPGSVGMPFQIQRKTEQLINPPWAEYVIITVAQEGTQIDFRRVPISPQAVVQMALESSMPHADWWSKDWI